MSDNIHVQETFINATEGYRFGDSDVYETWTNDRGKLFRDMQREYGRCKGKVWIDRDGAAPLQVGWVFQKRMQYEDSREWYTREVWVTLHTAPPTRSVKYHYLSEAGK